MKVIVANFTDVKSNKVWRLESEYYTQSSLVISDYVLGLDALKSIEYGTSESLNETGDGFPVLRLNEFDGIFIKKPGKYCNRMSNRTFHNLALKKDDVLVCRTNGNPKLVGKTAIVPMDYDYAFASYLFRIRPNTDIINSATLCVYLNNRIGRAEIEKNLMVSNQANFSPDKFRDIRIPKLDTNLQLLIETIVYTSFKYHQSAISFYFNAEQILLSSLGLDNWKSKRQLFFVKKLSETEPVDRIDAEFFQPLYDELIEKIKKYKNGYKRLGEILAVKDETFLPRSDWTYKYIELAHISENGNINGFIEATGKELPTRARLKVNIGDVIVSSIQGALSSIALINADLDNAICSTGFYIVKSDTLNSETLLVLLKSPVGQLQLEKGCSGTILAAISSEQFKRIILPDISPDVQKQIAQQISLMYEAKSTSTKLVEIAKNGIEIAIKKGEQEAQDWLNQEVQRLCPTIM